MTSAFAKNWVVGENVLSVLFSKDSQIMAFSLMDGTTLLVHQNGEEERIPTHPNGGPLSFCLDSDGQSFLSAGDDGRIVRLAWGQAPETLVEHKGAWIDNVTTHKSGLRAYSMGKLVYILGRSEPFLHPSTVGGIAFHPNGKRIAVSHYNGASLWWLNAKESKPQILNWKGSHLGILWHPAGDYLMTSMQDAALHGWRLKDMGELRMAGYPSKVHSMSFSARGKWLITSGAEQIICWPFTGSGPQGKPPMALGYPEGSTVTYVAAHPSDDMTAAGYANGRVILGLYEDRPPIELLAPYGEPVVAMAWNEDGRQLITAHQDGRIHLFTSQSIIAASEAQLKQQPAAYY